MFCLADPGNGNVLVDDDDDGGVNDGDVYQARARSTQARRACALRALGLLLSDGAPTVGGGKTF